jgi:hypothetical protein
MNPDQIDSLSADLNRLSLDNNWPALEAHFFHLTETCADPTTAARIKMIDLDPYITALVQFYNEQYAAISFHAIKAFYYEYDPDDLWKGTLFICDRYSPSRSASDEWSRHSIQKAAGPKLPEFAHLYQELGGFNPENDAQTAVSFYLIARTAAALGKAVAQLPLTRAAICIAHRGQKNITRIYEKPFLPVRGEGVKR